MVRTRPSSRMTTPLPMRSVPRMPAVNASSGTSARSNTIESSAPSRSNRASSVLGCISGGNAQLLRSDIRFPFSGYLFYGSAGTCVSPGVVFSVHLPVREDHEYTHQHRDGFQSKDLADFRRQGETRRNHAHTERGASVGAFLEAVALRRLRRIRDVVFLAAHGEIPGRRSLGGAADIHDAKVLPRRNPGEKGFGDRAPGRLERKTRGRSRVPADRGAVDARR